MREWGAATGGTNPGQVKPNTKVKLRADAKHIAYEGPKRMDNVREVGGTNSKTLKSMTNGNKRVSD